MNKTVVVETQEYRNHPIYKKRYKVTKKFYAHHEGDVLPEWTLVTIKEVKPLSKLKRWEVILEK